MNLYQCYKDSDDSFHRKIVFEIQFWHVYSQITHNNFLGVCSVLAKKLTNFGPLR